MVPCIIVFIGYNCIAFGVNARCRASTKLTLHFSSECIPARYLSECISSKMKRQNTEPDADNSTDDVMTDHPVGAMLKLQHRKEQLERRLEEKSLELKKLCMKEYELTGVLPRETPLGTDESPPKTRRKVATMYPYDKEFLKQLAQQAPEESLKRKALTPWNSCDNLPCKTSSPASPKHNTWTSPKNGNHSHSTARSHITKSIKFLRRQLHH